MSEVWVSYPELEDLIGRDAAQRLCLLHGGVPVYVPQKTQSDNKLTRLIGVVSSRALSSVYGGECITVPNGRRADPKKPHIVSALEKGLSHAAIALEFGVTERHVRAIAAQLRPRARQLRLI